MNLRAAAGLSALAILALTSCSTSADAAPAAPAPLSTEETCSEANAILAKHDSDVTAALPDLTELADQASSASEDALRAVIESAGHYQDVADLMEICGG